MGERLARLGVANEDGRDLVVEERAGGAAVAVRDVHALGRVLLHALVEVALEVRRAVLVRVHLRVWRRARGVRTPRSDAKTAGRRTVLPSRVWNWVETTLRKY